MGREIREGRAAEKRREKEKATPAESGSATPVRDIKGEGQRGNCYGCSLVSASYVAYCPPAEYSCGLLHENLAFFSTPPPLCTAPHTYS
jgi:hypothetical protein